jgi:hypothetical protein
VLLVEAGGKKKLYCHPTASGGILVLEKKLGDESSLEEKSNAQQLDCHHTAGRYAASVQAEQKLIDQSNYAG